MVPARGVDHLALEIADAGDVGNARLVEDAGGADHEARGDLVAVLSPEAPEVGIVVEGGARHLGVEADARADAVLVRRSSAYALSSSPGA